MNMVTILRVVGASIAIAASVAAMQAQAQVEIPSEWILCANEDKAYPPDIVADGCTAVIVATNRSPRERAVAYINRGLAYRATGEHSRALADYDAAIKLDPTYAPAYNNRGALHRDAGEFDRAIADYDEAIRIDPKSAVVLTNRGAAFADKGNLDRAIVDYDAAIGADPRYAPAFTNRGNAYRQKGDLSRAAADYGAAIEADPKNPIAYNNRGAAYRKLRKIKLVMEFMSGFAKNGNRGPSHFRADAVPREQNNGLLHGRTLITRKKR